MTFWLIAIWLLDGYFWLSVKILTDRGCVHRETSYVLFGDTLVVGDKTFAALRRNPGTLPPFVAGSPIAVGKYEVAHSPICNARTGW